MHWRIRLRLVYVVCLVLLVWSTRYKSDIVSSDSSKENSIPFIGVGGSWVDSMLLQMNTEEKIAQLFSLQLTRDTFPLQVVELIDQYQIGGIVYDGFSLTYQDERSKLYQSISQSPLLISTFANSQTLGAVDFPDDYQLASIKDQNLLENLAKGIVKQEKVLGNHLYITRHQSYDPNIVEPVLGMARLTQDQNLIHCLAFSDPPLPENIYYDTLAWEEALLPLYASTRDGIAAILLDSSWLKNDPLVKASPNTNSLYSYLRREINYKGLVLSQITNSDTSRLEIYRQLNEMFKVGVDHIVLKGQLPLAMGLVRDMLQRNILTYRELNNKVRRILEVKYWTGAHQDHLAARREDKRLFVQVEPMPGATLNRKLAENSLTLLKDSLNFIPLTIKPEADLQLLNIGVSLQAFEKQIARYSSIRSENIVKGPDGLPPINTRRLRRQRFVICAINSTELDTVEDKKFLESFEALSQQTNVLVVNFARAENLSLLDKSSALMQVYNNEAYTQEMAAQALFGGANLKGRLPMSVGQFARGTGILREQNRLGFDSPESVALASVRLGLIDSMVNDAIRERAMPGCQILIARKGKIVFQKAYGFQTYGRRRPVQDNDLYDVASITKVAATTLATMRMYDEKKIRLQDALGKYFSSTHQDVWIDTEPDEDLPDIIDPEDMISDTLSLAEYRIQLSQDSITSQLRLPPERSLGLPDIDSFPEIDPRDSMVVVYKPKSQRIKQKARIFDIRIEDLLSHHSGLPPGMPIQDLLYYRTPRQGRFGKFYSPSATGRYQVEVASKFFLRQDYIDSIWTAMKSLGIYQNDLYEYSDVNMILLQQMIDTLNQVSLNLFLDSIFYKPMGLRTTRFLPSRSLNRYKIVPTENDLQWRGQLLRGYVHDPAAALLGGVAGSAGLFSDAQDLAALMQMLLNNGSYGGKQYLDSSTVALFTQRQKGHRAYGFDMPPETGDYIIADSASLASFGHTGFTGTCVWVDPERELIFVFLSNRIHPSARNWKLNNLEVRRRIHQAIYDAFLPYQERAKLANRSSSALGLSDLHMPMQDRFVYKTQLSDRTYILPVNEGSISSGLP